MKSVLLSEVCHGRDNNFNLLRMLAASLVIVTHGFGITGHGAHEPLYQLSGLSLGSWAVDVFFVTSGFLVCKSFFNRHNPIEFLYARFMRIYPALWVSTLLVLLLVGPFYTQLSVPEYFTHIETLKYLLENTTLIIKGVVTSLPGVFTDHPSSVVNSPLWTLPYEVKMYLALAFLGWAGVLQHRGLTLIISITSGLLYTLIYTGLLPEYSAYAELTRFIFFFFTGAAVYLWRDHVLLSPLRLIQLCAVFIAGLVLVEDKAILRIVLALLTPMLVFHLAYLPEGLIRRYNSLGDYSYGIYIYGYPVQQIVFAALGDSVLVNIVLSLMLCILIAAISWHFLEKRALKYPIPEWLRRMGQHRWLRSRVPRSAAADTV